MERDLLETVKSSLSDDIKNVLRDLRNNHIMVLATSSKNIVAARNVSTLVIDDCIYFQTDSLMDKVKHIRENKNVALCIENYQIQGEAKEIGSWEDNKDILREYINIHKGSYEKYCKLKTEVVVEVKIKNIRKWEYENGKPYIEKIDIEKSTIVKEEYKVK